MIPPLFKINLVLSWTWILLGFLSGALMGLGFHREDWLGGYGSHRRRLLRLAHISFFGLAIINMLFLFTTRQLDAVTSASWIASRALVVGTLTMPVCCYIMAGRQGFQPLFAVPVSSLLTAVIFILWEVTKS